MYNNDTLQKRRRLIKLRKTAIMLILIAVIGGLFIFGFFSESRKRLWKDFMSDHSGGLNRTITVYDQNGNELRQWSGNIDIEENSYGNKVLFDLNGKRKVIYNAIVIAEEN